MQHQRQTGFAMNIGDALNIEHRRFLIHAVRRADHNRHRGHARLLRKALRLFDVRKVAHFFVGGSADMAQLALDAYAALGADFHGPARGGDVLVQRLGGRVDHDARRAQAQRAQHLGNARAMIQVQGHGRRQLPDRLVNRRRLERAELRVEHAREHLEDDRRARLAGRLHHAHGGFHVVAVKGGNGRALFFGQRQNLFEIRYHFSSLLSSSSRVSDAAQTCRTLRFPSYNRPRFPPCDGCTGLR